MSNSIHDLVAGLPEVYQPIFGHPELSSTVSRGCRDRRTHITQTYQVLETQLNRPLRVLDLGCAQGYFSLSLAKLGATVHGVDFLDTNIAVCQALAGEYPELKVSFQMGRVEDVLAQLAPDQYDCILGLSVFHHIVHEAGSGAVQQMLAELAGKVTTGIFELALASEPAYWASSQPENPRQLLEGFSFVHELAQHGTHLSDTTRPLYVASNRYWCLNGQAGVFDTWQTDSHVLAHGSCQGTRRYFFGSGLVVKLFILDHTPLYAPNLAEHRNEITFLLDPPLGFNAPRLLLHGQHEREAWLVREQLPGELLIDMMRGGKPYDARLTLQDVLAQLAALEAVGRYHSDVRAWNVLVSPEGRAKLIDYGSIVNDAKDCVWPRNIFLAFLIFVYEVTTGRVKDPSPLRTVAISPYRLDQPYRKWMMAFWSYPTSRWSFKLMQQLFVQMDSLEEDGELAESPALQHWMQAIEDTVEAQASATRHALWQQQQQSEKHKARLDILTGEPTASKVAKERLSAQLAEKSGVLSATEAALIQQQAHARWLQDEWKAAKAKIDELNHASHHWWTVADGLNHRLQDVYNTTSWRITRPLRKLDQLIGDLRRLLLQIHTWVVAALKPIVKRLILALMRFALPRPILQAMGLRLIARRPGLKTRLRLLALNNGLGVNLPTSAPTTGRMESGSELAQLTSSARRVYLDLKRAIGQRNQESG